jgi:ent-kaurene oxidase
LKRLDEWVSVQIYDILLEIVARISARVFVGPDLCRNKEWLHATVHYTENIFMTVMTLRMFPPFLHSFIAPILPSFWRMHANLRSAKRLISPIVRQRRADASKGIKGSSPDLLQMMMDMATEQEGDPDKLSHRQLLLSLASIHTTTMATAHAIYDLCAYPQYFEPLQQEIQAAYIEDPSMGKTTLNKLRKVDSFMKESQRMNPPSQREYSCHMLKHLTYKP